MAGPKNNKPLSLQIPTNRGEQAIESQLLALYELVDAKQAFLRELLYTGFLLRKLGVSQAIMDLERSGELDQMDDAGKREAIASMILGSTATLNSARKAKAKSGEAEIPPEPERKDASVLTNSFGA